MTKKLLAVLLVLALMLPLATMPVSAEEINNAYPNTHVNTGNQRQDLIGVAMSQLGYTELYENDTKYGDWYGFPRQPWCAMFISWCAEQAGIPTSILKKSAWANPGKDRGFNIACYSGTEYTPSPGDLLFIQDFNHVGIVYTVLGEDVITIEGNTNVAGSEDGFYVILCCRKLSECYVGVPAYEGCDANHTYIQGSDEAHPHANYFYCTTCGDTYYSGTYDHRTDCTACLSCGCSATNAWYRVTYGTKRVPIRNGHSTANSVRGYLDTGEAVYVLAQNGNWAHILYGKSVAYVPMDRLERFMPAPLSIHTDKNFYPNGEPVPISWEPVKNAVNYTMTVLRDGVQTAQYPLGGITAWELSNLESGNYEVQISADDAAYYSAPVCCTFTVGHAYQIDYYASGSSRIPSPQVKLENQPLTLSSTTPVRDGYDFLGWTDDPSSNCAKYQRRESWTEDRDAALYAVWKNKSATPVALAIETPARTTYYHINDPLDTAGLTLKLRYSDGSSILIKQDFFIEGFDSSVTGTKKLILRYDSLFVTYTVEVREQFFYNVDISQVVNKDDSVPLLQQVAGPGMSPLS